LKANKKNIEIKTRFGLKYDTDIFSSIFLILILTWAGLSIFKISTNTRIILFIIISIIALYFLSKFILMTKINIKRIDIIYPYNLQKSETIFTSQITKVKCSSSHPSLLIIFYKKNFNTEKVKISPQQSIYVIGHLLRYYKDIGIDIELIDHKKDIELFYYINGIIDDYPMRNDSKINKN